MAVPEQLLVPPLYVTPLGQATEKPASPLVVLSFEHAVAPVLILTATTLLFASFTTTIAYEQGKPPVTAPAGLASEPMMVGAAHATAPTAAVRLMSVRRSMPGRSTSRSARSLISYPVSLATRGIRRSGADYRRVLHPSSIGLPRLHRNNWKADKRRDLHPSLRRS